MLVLRTSNFQGATISRCIPRRETLYCILLFTTKFSAAPKTTLQEVSSLESSSSDSIFSNLFLAEKYVMNNKKRGL